MPTWPAWRCRCHGAPPNSAVTFAMWWIMMLGMMLPSAAPTILIFATMARRQRERGQTYVPASVFTIGYLLAWGVSVCCHRAATWGLDQAALLSPMLETNSALIGGGLFIAGGLYQFSPSNTHACKNAVRRSPSCSIMVRRMAGCAADGTAPRPLSPRLLLGVDGTPVRRRRDELALGRGHRRLRIRRKTAPRRHLDRPHRRRPDAGFGVHWML